VDLLDPTGTEGIARFLRDGRESGIGQFEIAYARPDASERRLRLTLSASSAVGDRHWLAMASDVTDLRRAEQELCHRRLHDDLTGLPNRTALEGQLDRVVARRQDHGPGSIAVVSADLDQFKLINKSHGRVAGDAVLLEVARRLAAAVRPEDTVGRISSDTFAVVCAESSDTRAGESAVRLQDALTEPFDLDGHAVNLSACVGVALCPPNAAPELLRCAETAMYRAKAVGPGTVRTFERDARKPAGRRRPGPGDHRGIGDG
jgi:diguanylate cyclase (GGDEF)-like protein